MAEKRDFDLSALMQNVKELNDAPAQEQIEYIPFEKLVPDPDNGYSMLGIKELADNIETVGIQQPLRVYPTDRERYHISSGHRRHAAFKELIKSGRKKKTDVLPCIVDRSSKSKNWREFELLMANRDNRKMTQADQSKELMRLQDVLRRLVDEDGVEFKGRMRDVVAELAGVSRAKVAKLNAIRNNLDKGLLKLFDDGVINASAAYELQKLPNGVQSYLAAQKKVQNNGVPADRAEEMAKNADKLLHPKCVCEDGSECSHSYPRFKQTAFADYNFRTCDGGCCMKCQRSLSECPYQCPKAKAMREGEREEKKAASEREEQKRQKQLAKDRQRLAAEYSEILNLAEAAKLPDSAMLALAHCSSVKDLRERAAGKGFYDWQIRSDNHPTSHVYAEDLSKTADALGVSLDFLLGQEERKTVFDSNTAPMWQTGEPDREGWYCCWATWEPATKKWDPDRECLYWRGCWFDTPRAADDCIPAQYEVHKWYRIPDDPEEA